MKCITLTPEEAAEWTANEHISGGPADIRARIIRRAKSACIAAGQSSLSAYLGHRAVVTVSRAVDGSWGQVAL